LVGDLRLPEKPVFGRGGMLEVQRPVACPDENQILAMVEHSLEPVAFGVIEAHIDGCAQCRRTVAALVKRGGDGHDAHAAAPPAIGDRYDIERELGRGGMGTVYLAKDRSLGRDVALKLHLAGSGHERLHREAIAMAKLAHPNVVTVFEVGSLDDRLYVAMEYVQGGTLRAWLAAEKRAWHEVVRLLIEVGGGLAAAHAAGLVHRDFKPENVLVGEDGRPRVGDFGLARVRGQMPALPAAPGSKPGPRPHVHVGASGSAPRATAVAASAASRDALGSDPTLAVGSAEDAPLTRTGALMGTPAYMAPEQLASAEIDARCDQFAFCVVAWECLYGARPFAGKSVVELALAIERRELASPARTDVPDRIRKVLVRGLATDPESRYADMPALLTALRAAAKPRTRRWIIASATAAVALAAGGFAATGAIRSHREAAACERVGDDVRALFGAEVRERVHQRFLASGVPIAQSAFDHTASVIDRELAGIAARMTELCGAMDPPALARRACLEQRRREVASFVDLLGRADAELVSRAPGAAWALYEPQPCSGEHAALAPSADAGRAERLARAQALESGGRYADAAAMAEAIRGDAEKAGDKADELAALMVLGDSRGELDPPEKIAPIYDRVLALAEKLGRDLDAAIALDRLANLAGDRQDFAAARRFLELGRAKLERLGDTNIAARGSLRLTEAQIAIEEFRFDVAERACREALAALEQAYGPEHPKVGAALGTLSQVLRAVGKRTEALTTAQRTLAIMAETLGSEHPTVAGSHMNIAQLMTDLGQYPQAHEELARAEAGFAKALGPENPMRGPLAASEAELALAQQDGAAAEAAYRKTLGFAEHDGASPADISGIHRDIARSLAMQGNLDAAIAENQTALGLLSRLGADGQTRMLGALLELGQMQRFAKRPNLAIPVLERAIASGQSTPDADPVELADARFTLAQSLRDTHRDAARAHKLAEQARDGQTDPKKRAEIEAWLSAR
jgi:serine/threonine protein kinase